MLDRAHQYFSAQAVLRVDTPSLGLAPVTDPQIDSLQTTAGQYLQTSPEFFMKRLLADGYPDIYSIGRVYRDSESGKRHLAEFTMIEWYRHGMQLDQIVADTTALIGAVLDRPELHAAASRLDYRDAFADAVGIDPLTSSIGQLADAAEADKRLRASLGENRDGWLDLVLATKIAATFADDRLTVVQHYPASQAALARLCPADARLADRFEVFYGDLELANGAVELHDATEQTTRMQADLETRREFGYTEVPIDSKLIAALSAGLPDCAGVAVGFERLHMIAAATDDIREVVTFAD